MIRVRTVSFSLLAIVALVGFAGPASAAIDDLDLYRSTVIDIDGTDYVVNEMKLDFTHQYAGAQLVLTLTAGSVYQNGSVTAAYDPPTAGEIAGDPNAALDTFTANGALVSSGVSTDTPGHADDPFAANLGSTGPAVFDTTGLDIEWYPDPNTEADPTLVMDQTDFLISRDRKSVV